MMCVCSTRKNVVETVCYAFIANVTINRISFKGKEFACYIVHNHSIAACWCPYNMEYSTKLNWKLLFDPL